MDINIFSRRSSFISFSDPLSSRTHFFHVTSESQNPVQLNTDSLFSSSISKPNSLNTAIFSITSVLSIGVTSSFCGSNNCLEFSFSMYKFSLQFLIQYSFVYDVLILYLQLIFMPYQYIGIEDLPYYIITDIVFRVPSKCSPDIVFAFRFFLFTSFLFTFFCSYSLGFFLDFISLALRLASRLSKTSQKHRFLG